MEKWAGEVSDSAATTIDADVVIWVFGRGIPLGLFVLADGGGGPVARGGSESGDGCGEDEEAAVAPGGGAG